MEAKHEAQSFENLDGLNQQANMSLYPHEDKTEKIISNTCDSCRKLCELDNDCPKSKIACLPLID